ncbi:MAG: transcriptional regulator, partial [Bacteroidetes bacterium HGW-Bacteroidetes-13]
MQKLTAKEEEIMHILWKLQKAFVNDVLKEIK